MKRWRDKLDALRRDTTSVDRALHQNPAVAKIIGRYDTLCSRLIEQVQSEADHGEGRVEVEGDK